MSLRSPFLRGSGRSPGNASQRDPTPGPRTGGGGAGVDIDRNIPVWDGRPHTLEHFAEEVELFVAGVGDRQLPLLGPRIARAHFVGTRQRSVALSLGMSTLRSAEGATAIIRAFEQSLADKPQAELWSSVQLYIFGATEFVSWAWRNTLCRRASYTKRR